MASLWTAPLVMRRPTNMVSGSGGHWASDGCTEQTGRNPLLTSPQESKMASFETLFWGLWALTGHWFSRVNALCLLCPFKCFVLINVETVSVMCVLTVLVFIISRASRPFLVNQHPFCTTLTSVSSGLRSLADIWKSVVLRDIQWNWLGF